jgi:hypothetical protein
MCVARAGAAATRGGSDEFTATSAAKSSHPRGRRRTRACRTRPSASSGTSTREAAAYRPAASSHSRVDV